MGDHDAGADVEFVSLPGAYGGAYSHAVRVGNVVFCSGVTAREPDGSIHAPGDAGAQARYCLERLRSVLQSVDCTFADVVKMTTYLTRPEDRAIVGEVRRGYFQPPLPASTLVAVAQLSHPDLLVEFDVIAAISRRPSARS